jgi:hypothetical protein
LLRQASLQDVPKEECAQEKAVVSNSCETGRKVDDTDRDILLSYDISNLRSHIVFFLTVLYKPFCLLLAT